MYGHEAGEGIGTKGIATAAPTAALKAIRAINGSRSVCALTIEFHVACNSPANRTMANANVSNGLSGVVVEVRLRHPNDSVVLSLPPAPTLLSRLRSHSSKSSRLELGDNGLDDAGYFIHLAAAFFDNPLLAAVGYSVKTGSNGLQILFFPVQQFDTKTRS